MVSVIMPTFNREKTIIRAINSIFRQTYKQIELIIVDDCSTDNTENVIKSLNNSKIIYIKHSENQGACAARNKGIKSASGEYIAFLDSDDEWLPTKIERQIDFIQSNNCDIVFCSHISYYDNEKEIIPNKKIHTNTFYKQLLYKNFITTGSILGKSECFKNINFDTNLPRLQDWDLMINMSQKFSIQHLHEVLTINYVQKDSITKDDKKGLEATKIIYSKIQNSKYMDNNIKANFYKQMGNFAMGSDASASKYFRESLKNKIDLKVFIKYIICTLRLQKLLQKIK